MWCVYVYCVCGKWLEHCPVSLVVALNTVDSLLSKKLYPVYQPSCLKKTCDLMSTREAAHPGPGKQMLTVCL